MQTEWDCEVFEVKMMRSLDMWGRQFRTAELWLNILILHCVIRFGKMSSVKQKGEYEALVSCTNIGS